MKENRALGNAAWLIACRVLQALLQLAVGMLCARYLGPANYGLLGYAASVCAFALPVMRLGFNETLVSEFVDHPKQEEEILGTALGLNLLSSLACMTAVTLFVSAVDRGDVQAILVCVLYSLSLLTGAMEMIRYWFQYRLLAKFSAVAGLAAYAMASAYRIGLLMGKRDVAWFALTGALEYGLTALLLAGIYLHRGHRFRFSWHRAGAMLRRSVPYIGASAMVVLFQNTDHIMLTAMAGPEENGIYTAAITCVTLGQFVYVAIVDSFRPGILACRQQKQLFDRRMTGLYGVILGLAAVQGIVLALAGPWLVQVLYGRDYLAAVPVLGILNVYFVFSCMGLARNVWILAREKQRYLWIINLSGAVLNIGLNLWWIPETGAMGAAAASLVTQIFANFVMGWILKPIRENNILLIRLLQPKALTDGIRSLLSGKETEENNVGTNGISG